MSLRVFLLLKPGRWDICFIAAGLLLFSPHTTRSEPCAELWTKYQEKLSMTSSSQTTRVPTVPQISPMN
jgi:hypothetical protein